MNRKNEWYVFLSGMFSALVIFLVYLFGATDAFAGESNVEERPAIIQQSASPTVPQVVDMRRQSTQSVQQQVPAQPPWLKEKGTLLPFEQHGYSKEQLDVQEGGCHWLKCRREKFCDSVKGVANDIVCFPTIVVADRISEVACSPEWLDEQRSDFGCLSPCNPCSWICGTATLGGKAVKGVVGATGFTLQQTGKGIVHTLDAVSVFTPVDCDFRLAGLCELPSSLSNRDMTGIVAE